jgi:hypothetical protein
MEQELLEIYDKLEPKIQKEMLDYAYEKLELQELRKKARGEAPVPDPDPEDFPLVPRHSVPPLDPATAGIEEKGTAG